MSETQNLLRATFDQVALLYDRVRPGYPEALIEDILSLTGLPPGGSILEIGCGTGQATLPFARRGYRVLAIELGSNMAAVARHNLAAYPQARVWTGAFEDWPVQAQAFDLVISATAFHWIDPAIGYPKMAQALRPGGAIALFWNQHIYNAKSERFFETVQEVYRQQAPEIYSDEPMLRAEEFPEPVTTEIEKTGLFGPVTTRRYAWEQPYDTESYLDVLRTYSGHIQLSAPVRERLFAGIRDLIETQPGGIIYKDYLSQLYIAQRK